MDEKKIAMRLFQLSASHTNGNTLMKSTLAIRIFSENQSNNNTIWKSKNDNSGGSTNKTIPNMTHSNYFLAYVVFLSINSLIIQLHLQVLNE